MDPMGFGYGDHLKTYHYPVSTIPYSTTPGSTTTADFSFCSGMTAAGWKIVWGKVGFHMACICSYKAIHASCTIYGAFFLWTRGYRCQTGETWSLVKNALRMMCKKINTFSSILDLVGIQNFTPWAIKVNGDKFAIWISRGMRRHPEP